MKIKPEHLAHMRSAIDSIILRNPDILARYRAGDFPRAEQCKDKQTRFNFDLFYAAIPSAWVCRELYPYCDDSHIASALRSICPKL
jgi:hypothetical protein